MAGCRFATERAAGRTVIRVEGCFDRESAGLLARQLEASGGDELVLDFSLVSEFADLGVAALAHGLSSAERPLRLLGLRRHQVRMFRYFGLLVEPLPMPSDSEPAGPLPSPRPPSSGASAARSRSTPSSSPVPK